MVSIIVWLLKNCRSNQRHRLVGKFTENDHEKVDRLLELHFKYLEKVLATNANLEEQARVSQSFKFLFISKVCIKMIFGIYRAEWYSRELLNSHYRNGMA